MENKSLKNKTLGILTGLAALVSPGCGTTPQEKNVAPTLAVYQLSAEGEPTQAVPITSHHVGPDGRNIYIFNVFEQNLREEGLNLRIEANDANSAPQNIQSEVYLANESGVNNLYNLEITASSWSPNRVIRDISVSLKEGARVSDNETLVFEANARDRYGAEIENDFYLSVIPGSSNLEGIIDDDMNGTTDDDGNGTTQEPAFNLEKALANTQLEIVDPSNNYAETERITTQTLTMRYFLDKGIELRYGGPGELRITEGGNPLLNILDYTQLSRIGEDEKGRAIYESTATLSKPTSTQVESLQPCTRQLISGGYVEFCDVAQAWLD